MDREIIWSVWASDDLVSVAEHISRDSESYAATVVRELVAAARSLRVFAERGRQVSRTAFRRASSFRFKLTLQSVADVGGMPRVVRARLESLPRSLS